jgi:glutamate-ammonia-ligase adenylyltransferase
MPERWPLPADEAAAERLCQRFSELGRAEAKLVRIAAPLLRCLGGNSVFLSDLAVREAATLRLLVREGPDEAARRAMAGLRATSPTTPRAKLAARLRDAKRSLALTIAIADLGAIWSLEQVVAALSDLAEATLQLAVAHLLRAAHDAGELQLPNPAQPAVGCGFTVLGMGKLGARELNYSSDVDLILLHDPDAQVYHGESPGAFHTRLARDLVTLMQARDADGYVFRTDLRLRPDPAATPPCIALPAAIAYYESMGQNWERAAMLKARPVAGDLALGTAFLDAIRPFVWRRHLDFAAVADIHAMKRRIDAHKGTDLGAQPDPVSRIAGHNVKLGQGGIREIEFLAQTLQLVWGGRDPTLRAPRTLQALRLLAQAEHLGRQAAIELAAAYRFLRRVEHRLQMVADRQTHTLPERADQLADFAVFMFYDGAPAFARALLRHLNRVQMRYREVFEAVPDSDAIPPQVELDFHGAEPAPLALTNALHAMGYANTEPVIAAVRGWQAGRPRALRSPRARELMADVLPRLLAALARHTPADATFARFDAFLAGLPAGVQLLSLFQRNPGLIDRVAAVLGAAPSLADQFARTPSSLEGLLSPELPPPHPKRLLAARLADARSLEDAIAITRALVRESALAISVATLEGRLDVDAAGLLRSGLADAALSALLVPVLADFAVRHGRVRGGAVAVVLLGKAGGREMMAGSDLDLMLIYDHPETVSESRGKRRLPASQWFIRAAHAYVAAITAPDADGPMYAVDMRLRPSGNKGPVAVSLAAFAHYHESDAWTWERMALTRARVVAGPAPLRRRVEAAIREAILNAGPASRIRADATAMRARMLRDLPPGGPWDAKLRPGGQVEVEFIAQTLQLVNASAHPDMLSPTSRVAFARLEKTALLPAADARLLIRADLVWRSVISVLRIAHGGSPRARLSAAAAAAAIAMLGRATGQPGVDLDELVATLNDVACDVRDCFNRHVGELGP